MRTDTEMLDLVRSKVRRRRTRQRAMVAAGGSLAAVVLLVTVAVAAGDPSADGRVQAGPGETTTEPTTPETTERPTTSTAPPETTTTTEAAPSTTSSTAPPPTTTQAPPTSTQPTGPTTQAVVGRDGDLEVQFDLTTDPARPGVVVVRVRGSDPTGAHHPSDGGDYGLWGMAMLVGAEGFGDDVAYYGPVQAGCGGGILSGPAERVGPDSVDTTLELVVPSGHRRIRLLAVTLFCMDEEDGVELVAEVDVP